MGLPEVPPEWNALTSRIIDAAMEVHTTLGPGMLEEIYEDALCIEFSLRSIPFQRQLTFPVTYKGRTLRKQRCDLLVEGLVVVELKSTVGVDTCYLSTLLGYMRALDVPLGLLLNFNENHLRDGLHRRINSRSSKMPRPHLGAPPTILAHSASSHPSPSSPQRTSA